MNGKVFLLESPNALDLLEGRGERSALEQVCRLFGHDATSFVLRDKRELAQTLKYLSSIGVHDGAGSEPLFIHISAHGNHEGIGVGSDRIPWKVMTNMISDAYRRLDQYPGPVVLILSACGANEQELTSRIEKRYEKKR